MHALDTLAVLQAFLAKARVAHPDKKGTKEAFACLQAAAQVLLDPVQRREHDKALSLGLLSSEAQPRRPEVPLEPSNAATQTVAQQTVEVRGPAQGMCCSTQHRPFQPVQAISWALATGAG